MAEFKLIELTKKYLDIRNKIGRERNKNDHRQVITYLALTEYVKMIEPIIMLEPEYITIPSGDAIKNPDFDVLEALKETIINIDKELRLSLWAK